MSEGRGGRCYGGANNVQVDERCIGRGGSDRRGPGTMERWRAVLRQSTGGLPVQPTAPSSPSRGGIASAIALDGPQLYRYKYMSGPQLYRKAALHGATYHTPHGNFIPPPCRHASDASVLGAPPLPRVLREIRNR